MTRGRFVLLVVLAMAWLVVLPAGALAQSAIAGVVTDTSGGVLPGVTVEAASPALIEKTRAVVTDSQGRFTIVDLRPGLYTVTFALTGFNTVVRDGISLPSSFTATVNVELRVGALEETVTVSGQAPLVDVHSVQRTEKLSQAVVEMLPLPRMYRTMSLFLPAVSGTAAGGNRPAVGEVTIAQSPISQGATAYETVTEIDGVPVTTLHQSTSPPHNDAMVQEATYQTSALTADSSRGALRINLIGKDGGNLLSGGGTFNESDGSWQANNLTQELIDRKLGPQNHLNHSFDVNPYAGGPIKRDKVWLFASFRYQEQRQFVARTTGGLAKDEGLLHNTDHLANYTARLTWQVTSKHQIKLHGDYVDRPLNSPVAGSVEASNPLQSMYWVGIAKWSAPLTNRLLLEAGYSWNVMGIVKNMYPGVEEPRGTPAWYAKAARVDIGTGLASVAGTTFNSGEGIVRPVLNTLVASSSYVTGTHNLKVGLHWSWGYLFDKATNNADLNQIYLNGVPAFVDVLITPFERRESVNADLGIYAQDSWVIQRLTLSAGVRFDHFNASIDATSAPAGRFVPARSFPAVPNLPDFNNVQPRLGASYDLFGDGRTAIKASVGKYVAGYALGNAGATGDYDPMGWQGFYVGAGTADRRDWTDRDRLGRDLPTNGDNIAQDNEIGPTTNLNFGLKGPHRLEKGFTRPYSVEYAASVQREVKRNVSVAMYDMYRPFRNLLRSQDQLVSLSDYTAFQAVSPLNGESITIFNLNPEKRGLVDLLDSNSKINMNSYTGYHLFANVGLPGGGVLMGGWSAERLIKVTCDTNNPNQFRFCDTSGKLHQDAGATKKAPFTSSFKFIGAFPGLPFGLTGGVAMRSFRESVLGVNWVVPASAFPGGQRTVSVTVPLIAPNTKFLPRWTQLDLSAKRTFRVGTVELAADLTVFNVVNSSVVLAELQTFGPSLGTPTSIIPGRVPRIGLQMRF